MDNFTSKWQKFHEGSLSKLEAIEFLHFLETDLGKAKFQEHLNSIWNDQDEEKPLYDDFSSKSFSYNCETASQPKKYPFFNKLSNIKQTKFKTFIKFAACLIALIFILKNSTFLPEFTQKESKEVPNEVWITKSNSKGIKSRILLPDSSWVYLNAGSKISYPQKFRQNRHVYLVGEAFFEVFEDKNHPFIVEACHVKTQVLGTSFNINSLYPESVEIGLVTGAIKISNVNTGKDILLSPGEGSKIIPSNQEMEKYKIDPQTVTQWKEGILHFDNENFERVIQKLENWYGVEITVNGEAPKGNCNGTFQKHTYLSNVLKVLGHALNFNYKIDKNKVTINAKVIE